MNETLFYVLALVPALVIAIVFHEVAHGWAALALGDPTAKERRRLSLNPIRHVDPLGTLIVPGMLALAGAPVFGWAKPVPVIKERLDNPRFGMMAVAAAGPATNFVLAAIGAIALGVLMGSVAGSNAPVAAEGYTYGPWVQYLSMALLTFMSVNLFLGLFNLLPIPPFDGSHIVEGLLPPRAAKVYERLRPLGFPMLFILLVAIPWLFPQLGIVERVVLPPMMWLQNHYFMLTSWVAGLGF